MLKKLCLMLALVMVLPFSSAHAVAAVSVFQENIGSARLVIATFANTTDDGDTWASGLSGIVAFWAQVTEDPTQGKEGVNITESSGTFTFHLGEDNAPITLYVIVRN